MLSVLFAVLSIFNTNAEPFLSYHFRIWCKLDLGDSKKKISTFVKSMWVSL